jgi:hypothetical protein
MRDTKKTLHGPEGIRVELDRDQWFPDNPGNGTPDLVYLTTHTGEEANAPYDAAMNEGHVLGLDSDREYKLMNAQLRWLASVSKEIDSFLGL